VKHERSGEHGALHDPEQSDLGDHSKAQHKSRLWMKLAVVLLSVLVAVGAAEVGLRLLTPQQLGFEYRNGKFVPPRLRPKDATCNSLGYHDVEHATLAQPDVRRVVLLGDSYVAAGTMQIPATPGQRLLHHLNAGSDRQYEVISIGQGGWDGRTELQAWQAHGAGFSPGVVVTLFLAFNDVENVSESLSQRAAEQRKILKSVRPGRTRAGADEMPFLIFRWSVLNRLISHRLAYFLRDRTPRGIPSTYFVYADPHSDEWERAWRTAERIILETKQAVTAAGARYVVVSATTPHGVWGPEEGLRRLKAVYPGMRESEWNLDKPDQRLARFCREHDIPFLALEPAFRIETIENGRRLHLPINGHWNEEGNDLAGRLIAEFLLKLEAGNATPAP